MKVRVSTKSNHGYALRRRFLLENDIVVQESPELDLPESFFHNPVLDVVTKGFFGEGAGQPTHFFTRWWDAKWHVQTAVGIPLRGLMSEGLGADCYNGCSLRFIEEFNDPGFENPHFQDMLRLTGNNIGTAWKGFVSFVMSENKVVWVEKSVPFHGLFPLLEAPKVRRSQFLSDPMKHRFEDKWFYCGLLLSRYPWPFRPKTGESIRIEDITRRVEQHFWLLTDGEPKRYSIDTTATEIGVATAWSDTLGDCVYRVDTTCRNMNVQEKQFRTDAYKAFSKQWDHVSTLL